MSCYVLVLFLACALNCLCVIPRCNQETSGAPPTWLGRMERPPYLVLRGGQGRVTRSQVAGGQRRQPASEIAARATHKAKPAPRKARTKAGEKERKLAASQARASATVASKAARSITVASAAQRLRPSSQGIGLVQDPESALESRQLVDAEAQNYGAEKKEDKAVFSPAGVKAQTLRDGLGETSGSPARGVGREQSTAAEVKSNPNDKSPQASRSAPQSTSIATDADGNVEKEDLSVDPEQTKRKTSSPRRKKNAAPEQQQTQQRKHLKSMLSSLGVLPKKAAPSSATPPALEREDLRLIESILSKPSTISQSNGQPASSFNDTRFEGLLAAGYALLRLQHDPFAAAEAYGAAMELRPLDSACCLGYAQSLLEAFEHPHASSNTKRSASAKPRRTSEKGAGARKEEEEALVGGRLGLVIAQDVLTRLVEREKEGRRQGKEREEQESAGENGARGSECVVSALVLLAEVQARHCFQPSAALHHLREAVELDPAHPRAREALAWFSLSQRREHAAESNGDSNDPLLSATQLPRRARDEESRTREGGKEEGARANRALFLSEDDSA